VTFLFDIGRVLLDFHYEASLATLFSEEVTDRESRLERLLERKDDFEAGRVIEEEFIDWGIERLGSSASPDLFRDAWRNIFTPNEPMWNVAERLHAAGHRLILFSNINSIHSPWIFTRFPRFSLFHGAVMSFEVGALKPEPEIYEHAISTYDLNPSETRYIDDLPANIATGKAMGMRVWQYDIRNHGAFEAWLEQELALDV
jgi:HAD superfamily hydrolase (TIGR01509 family)